MNDYRCPRCGRLQFRGTPLGEAVVETKCRCKLILEFSAKGCRIAREGESENTLRLRRVAKSG